MKGKFNYKLAALCALLSVVLAVPALAADKTDMAERFKQARTRMIEQLKLPPEKEKALTAVEAKYVEPRQAVIATLKKARIDLQAALAAPTRIRPRLMNWSTPLPPARISYSIPLRVSGMRNWPC